MIRNGKAIWKGGTDSKSDYWECRIPGFHMRVRHFALHECFTAYVNEVSVRAYSDFDSAKNRCIQEVEAELKASLAALGGGL